MSVERYLLVNAKDDVDECEGMTLLQLLKYLAHALGYKLVKAAK